MNCSTKQLSAEFLGRPFLGAKCLTVVLLTCFITSGPLPCFGQAYTATLSGTVTDPQGAVIPGATVHIKNQNTAEERQATTGGDGVYIFSQLLPGPYEVRVSSTGFKTFLRRNLNLLASRSSELDVSLELGELAQTVEVVETAALLDTKSANQSTTLSRTLVQELPTSVRSPFALVLTQAAANVGIFGEPRDFPFDQTFAGFGLNGSRSMGSLILIDGAPAQAADWGGLIVSPTVEAVQEFQIVQNTYDAQFSKSGGGIVSLVTRGGGPEFHGSLFEFFQGENLNATTYSSNRFTNPGCNTPQCNRKKKGEFKRHQFGGAVSGPLWRSKRVYFFAAYEGFRQPFVRESGLRTLPTALQRQGDFSQTYNPGGTLAVIYNPFTTRPDPNNPGKFLRDPFDPSCVGVVAPATCPGNKIPANLIDPVGAQVVKLWPDPNVSPANPLTNEGNFFKLGAGSIINDKIDARVDWARSDKHRIFGKINWKIRQNNKTACFYCNGADSEKSDLNPGWHATLDNTFTPNPTLVISVVVGASRWIEEQISPALGVLKPSSVGLKDSDFHAALVPFFGAEGFADLGFRFGQKVRAFPRYTHTLQVNTTKEMGSHSIKFGFWGEVGMVNNVDRFSGNFLLGRGLTSCDPDPGGTTCFARTLSTRTGNSIASLLLGTPSFGNSTFNADIAGKMPYYSGYLQDQWRVNRRLTLNFGIRYERQPGATERFNRISRFDMDVTHPLAAASGLPIVGGFEYASPGDRGQWPTDKQDWAPRFGFAFRVTDKLVMRGGVGLFYVPASSLYTFDSPGAHFGFSTNTDMISTVGQGGFIPQDTLSNPFPNALNQPTGSANGVNTGLGQFIGQMWTTEPHPTGYKQNFSLNFQYEMQTGTILELGYSGFRARHLVFGNPNLNINQLHPSHLALGSALDELVANPLAGLVPGFLGAATIPRHRLLRRFPHFNGFSLNRSHPGATNNYNAFYAKFTRQFRGGLTVLSQYQWSKNLDNASEDQGWSVFNNQWRDYHNRKIEYSVSSHDVPQSFTSSLLYELPFGRGKRFGSNMPGWANHVAGGWQVSSVVRLQSGFPILLFAPGTGIGRFGFGRSSANLVDTRLLELSSRGPGQWFNSCTQMPDGSRRTCASPTESVAWVVLPQFPLATFGNAPRFISNWRTDYTKNTDLTIAKFFNITERYRLQIRADFFNAWNTPRFSSPDSFVSGGNFGQVFGTSIGPRNIQLALKFLF